MLGSKLPKFVSHGVTAHLSHEICQGLLFVLQAFFPIFHGLKKNNTELLVLVRVGGKGVLVNLPSKCECPIITEVRKLGRGRGT